MKFRNPFRKPRPDPPEPEPPPWVRRTLGGVPREAPDPPADRDFSKPPGTRLKREEKT